MIPQRERSRIRRAAQPTAELEVVLPLVRLHVRPDRVQRRERPIALGARERLDVAVLVSGQLHARLERLRAVRALVRAHVRVRQQVMVEHAVRLEALAAVRALVGARARVRAHVQRQAVADAERLAAYLADVRFFPGVYAFVFDFFVRAGKTTSAVLALVAALLAVVDHVLLKVLVGEEGLFAI